MTTRRRYAGASPLTYTLGIGLSIIAFLLIASTVNSGPVSSLLINAQKAEKAKIAQANDAAAQKEALALSALSLKKFKADDFKAASKEINFECLIESKICIPVYLNQAQINEQSLRLLEDFKQESLKQSNSEELNALFRELSELSLELANRQENLGKAIEKKDSAKVRKIVTQLNGQSETYINSSCSPEASFCLSSGKGFAYNIVYIEDPDSLASQIQELQNRINNHPDLIKIENASTTLDAIFARLNQEIQNTSILLRGNPALSKKYSKSEVQDFISTLIENKSYIRSLNAFKTRDQLAKQQKQKLKATLSQNFLYTSDSKKPSQKSKRESEAYQKLLEKALKDPKELDKAVSQSSQRLIDALTQYFMKNPKFAAHQLSKDPFKGETYQDILKISKDILQESPDNSLEFALAKRLRHAIIRKTDMGHQILKASVNQAMAKIALNDLKKELSNSGNKPKLITTSIEILSKNPELASDFEELSSSGVHLDLFKRDSTSKRFMRIMSKIESTKASHKSLNQSIELLKSASKIHCETGQGELKAESCQNQS